MSLIMKRSLSFNRKLSFFRVKVANAEEWVVVLAYFF